MKIAAELLILLALALASAGCMAEQQSVPQTTVPTATPVPETMVTTAPAVPSELVRSWKLSLMAIQNGRRIVRPTTDITLNVWPNGTIVGYGGCNNYNSVVTFSGMTTPKGNAIAVGPVAATKRYCQVYSDQESLYLAILQKAMAYTINGDKLTISATDGTAVGFDKVR